MIYCRAYLLRVDQFYDELAHLGDRLAHLGNRLTLCVDRLALLAEALHSFALHCGAPAVLLCRVVLVVVDVLGDLLCKRRDLLCEGLLLFRPLPMFHGGGVWLISCLLLICHLSSGGAALALGASSALALASSALALAAAAIATAALAAAAYALATALASVLLLVLRGL